MNRTKIEWVQNPDGTPGYTFNPITGCLNGCTYCYARKLANWRLKSRYLANLDIALPYEAPPNPFKDPFYPRFWQDKLDQPVNLKKPAGIFVCDMADLFGKAVPEQWTGSVMNFIEACPQHRFYLLTKQPQNLAKWSPFPSNCWVGFSATDGPDLYRSLLPMMAVKATVKFVSFEPLLSDATHTKFGRLLPQVYGLGLLDWVIVGAQTKPVVMPKREWVDDIIQSCPPSKTRVFLKNSLKPLYPEGLRQEMPNCGEK